MIILVFTKNTRVQTISIISYLYIYQRIINIDLLDVISKIITRNAILDGRLS